VSRHLWMAAPLTRSKEAWRQARDVRRAMELVARATSLWAVSRIRGTARDTGRGVFPRGASGPEFRRLSCVLRGIAFRLAPVAWGKGYARARRFGPPARLRYAPVKMNVVQHGSRCTRHHPFQRRNAASIRVAWFVLGVQGASRSPSEITAGAPSVIYYATRGVLTEWRRIVFGIWAA